MSDTITCAGCREDIKRTSKYITCLGLCFERYHIKCAGVTENRYQSLAEKPNLSWRCNYCVHVKNITIVARMEKISSQIEKLNEIMQKQQMAIEEQRELIEKLKGESNGNLLYKCPRILLKRHTPKKPKATQW